MLRRVRERLDLLWLLPVGTLAAWVALLIHRVPALIPAIGNSDSVGPMLVAESLGRLPTGTPVTMASEGNYTTLALDFITRGLPAHREVWEALPLVMEAAGLALLAWAVHRLAGWRAALVSVAIGLATPPLLLAPLLSQAYHNTAFLNVFVLAAMLVWMAGAERPWTWPRLLVYAAVTLLTGADLASDHLLGFIGIAPFAIAPALLALHRRNRRSVELLGVAVAFSIASAVVAKGFAHLGAHAGFNAAALSFAPASPGRMASNALLLRNGLLTIGNGSFSLPSSGLGLLRFVCALLMVAGVLVPLWLLIRFALRGDTAKPTGDRRLDDARGLFAAYWGSSALIMMAAFVVSQAPVDVFSIRYLAPVLYAVAATVPLIVGRSRLRRAVAGVAVALVGAYGASIVATAAPDDFSPNQKADLLIGVLESQNLHHGYAGYWQSDMVTWTSAGHVESRAVIQEPACAANQPGWFCPYPVNAALSWDRPEPGPSFFVAEDNSWYFPEPFPDWHPIRTFRVQQFTVYVFDHDIGMDAATHTAGWPSPSPAG